MLHNSNGSFSGLLLLVPNLSRMQLVSRIWAGKLPKSLKYVYVWCIALWGSGIHQQHNQRKWGSCSQLEVMMRDPLNNSGNNNYVITDFERRLFRLFVKCHQHYLLLVKSEQKIFAHFSSYTCRLNRCSIKTVTRLTTQSQIKRMYRTCWVWLCLI